VHQLVVIAEPLAVIRKRGDDGVGIVSGRTQPVEDASDLRVGEGDLAVVRVSGKPLLEW